MYKKIISAVLFYIYGLCSWAAGPSGLAVYVVGLDGLLAVIVGSNSA
jgi:hypothetical protein